MGRFHRRVDKYVQVHTRAPVTKEINMERLDICRQAHKFTVTYMVTNLIGMHKHEYLQAEHT